jgi:ATP-binding cassette subfamily B protein/subfamily B ATP-binding cassette protein MsbA
MSIYRRVFLYYRPFLRPTALALAISLVTIALNLAKPWPFQIIVDRFLKPHPAGAGVGPVPPDHLSPVLNPAWSVHTDILLLCAFLVGVTLSGGLLGLWSNFLFVRVGLEALLKLRTDLFAYLQSLPLKYHDARRSSDSSFRVAYDSQSIQTIYNRGFTNIFASVITLVSIFLIMVRMDWELTLLSVSIVPAVVLAIHHFSRRIREQSTSIQEKESAVLALAQEGLSSIKVVHAFGREETTVSLFQVQARQSLAANLRLTMTNVKSALVINTLMAGGTAAMIYLGTLHVLDMRLTLGGLTVFMSYLAMLYAPIEALTQTAWALEGAAAGAQRCFEVLDHADDVQDQPGAATISTTTGAVRFEGVDFGYSPERLILHGIDLDVLPGQRVAFVGGTGAGKTSLLSLVPRFYDPTNGRLTLDGRDLRSITRKSLRAQISLVLQETVLFSTTIRENIAYGRPGATEDEIKQAARRAQAYDFIMAMPQGFDSAVGERGGNLSVGQRQRIGIARAFLKDSPILLLDEPTSALDPATERAIMDTLEELMRGRTTLIITHRLATVHHLDNIVVLADGRIAETGTGEDLLRRQGAYAKLYRAGNFSA